MGLTGTTLLQDIMINTCGCCRKTESLLYVDKWMLFLRWYFSKVIEEWQLLKTMSKYWQVMAVLLTDPLSFSEAKNLSPSTDSTHTQMDAIFRWYFKTPTFHSKTYGSFVFHCIIFSGTNIFNHDQFIKVLTHSLMCYYDTFRSN